MENMTVVDWPYLRELITGTNNMAVYIAMWFFAMVGVSIIIMIDTMKRNPFTDNSPVPFSFKFWFWNNLFRVIMNVLWLIPMLRFPTFILPVIDVKNDVAKCVAALVMGLTADFLGPRLINKARNIAGEEKKT